MNFACATDYMTVSVVRVRIMPDTQNLDMLIANDTAFQGRTLWLDNISYDALG